MLLRLTLAIIICLSSAICAKDSRQIINDLDRLTSVLLGSALENQEAQKLLQNCTINYQQGGAKARTKTCVFTDAKGNVDKDIAGKLDPLLCYWLKFAQHTFKHAPNQPLRHYLLLYGPPGNGKTLVAHKLAELSGWSLIHRSGASIVGRYIGTAQKNINEMFDETEQLLKANPNTGVVVLIDEIDHIAGNNRHESKFDHRAGCAELWQKLDQYAQHPRVIFVAITNCYEKLDATFLDRFNDINKIFIDNPDPASRQEILIKTFSTIHMSVEPANPQLQQLIKMTDGLSIRKLEGLIGSVKVFADLNHDGKISWDLIMEVATDVIEDHKRILL